ncbi:peptidase domain-containing ABC transporter [Janthinobacterium psychrotolerans]|uniref:Cyclolysin secretion/processing ATP-binding protein CyaB n=1 Tax=Janthinobacterium psychrotolerans TaxID=1747903 RepID=A0A1A7C071_9BURK|nr:peptidase domain-containing ABC transporter [Janthinobacterium psychrotolerans]OBV38399.1 ATP-binding cassette, subfamily B, RaxB [Janthinobacterium psychrotolerans]
MSILDGISFGFRRQLPAILQIEAAECGLACVAMIAAYHGNQVDPRALRQRFSVSLKGISLTSLVQIAKEVGLASRPVKLDLEDLQQLRLPCILHWNLNHFVVLKRVDRNAVVIHDPARGVRKLSFADVSRAFSGVALELWPDAGFEQQQQKPTIRLRALMGNVSGLYAAFAQIIVLALVLEVFAIVSPLFMQWLIDDVVVSNNGDLLTTLVIGFALLMLLQQAVGAVRTWCVIYMGTSLNIQWRANVFSHLVNLPVEYFEKRHIGDIVSRFGSVDQIQRTLTTSFIEAVLDGLMTLITLLMMFRYSTTLGMVAVTVMCLYALSRWMWYSPLRNATSEQIIFAAKQQSHFLETVRGIKTIKLFGRQDIRRASWLSLVVDQTNADLRTQKLQMLYRQLNGLLFGAENLITMWLGTRYVLDGAFSVGALMAFNSYKGQFDSRVGSLIDKYFEVKMLQLHGERLTDIVWTEPELTKDSLLGEPEEGAPPLVEVLGLTYRYAEHEPMVLKGINLRIEPGESVAITGPSGCGKTTLLNLLLGVLAPTEGEVLVDGVSITNTGVAALRNMVGTVLQDDVLFAGSIADNICFFDPRPDQKWIHRCAEMASISQEIAAMPMGYNTLVGDMGTVLSGGQKQRVLLARALYKRPRILLLDEATSHLDVGREQMVNQLVESLNITRIIIAHRQETIATAKRVITIGDGRIVRDTGTPSMAMVGGGANHSQEQIQIAAS